jgi:hypothetical protein
MPSKFSAAKDADGSHMGESTYVVEEETYTELASFPGVGGKEGFLVPAMCSDFTQEGDDEIFPYMSMKLDEDKVDFSSQTSTLQKHMVLYDTNFTQLQVCKKDAKEKKRKKHALDESEREKNFSVLRQQLDAVKHEFSKKQLLDLILPVSRKSFNKKKAADRKLTEARTTFGYFLQKVREGQVKETKVVLLIFLGDAIHLHLTFP